MSDSPSTDIIVSALKIVGDNLMATDESSARVCRQAAHRLSKLMIQSKALEDRAEWLQGALSEAEDTLDQIDNMELQ